MTSSFSFSKIMDSWYNHVDDLAVILPSLADIRTKLQSECVKSCLAIGCGHGTMELPFIQACMPNLSRFTAVEPDAESVAVLKTKLAERLPNLPSAVFQVMTVKKKIQKKQEAIEISSLRMCFFKSPVFLKVGVVVCFSLFFLVFVLML